MVAPVGLVCMCLFVFFLLYGYKYTNRVGRVRPRRGACRACEVAPRSGAKLVLGTLKNTRPLKVSCHREVKDF